MNVIPRVEQWLYTTLTGISGVNGIYSGVAPTTATAPYIVMHDQSPGSDHYTVNGDRTDTDPLMAVRVVGKVAGWSTLTPIADEIDARLDGASGTAAGVRIIHCQRVEEITRIDPGDPQYRHLGGLYRCLVQGV